LLYAILHTLVLIGVIAFGFWAKGTKLTLGSIHRAPYAIAALYAMNVGVLLFRTRRFAKSN
jgi:hypothetical protein